MRIGEEAGWWSWLRCGCEVRFPVVVEEASKGWRGRATADAAESSPAIRKAWPALAVARACAGRMSL